MLRRVLPAVVGTADITAFSSSGDLRSSSSDAVLHSLSVPRDRRLGAECWPDARNDMQSAVWVLLTPVAFIIVNGSGLQSSWRTGVRNRARSAAASTLGIVHASRSTIYRSVARSRTAERLCHLSVSLARGRGSWALFGRVRPASGKADRRIIAATRHRASEFTQVRCWSTALTLAVAGAHAWRRAAGLPHRFHPGRSR